MADIIRRGERGMVDPFQLMRDMFRWEPFRELGQATAPVVPGEYLPSFELKETKDSYVMKADIPGVKEEDLEVSLVGNTITVSGKREAERVEEGERFHTYERTYGTFARSFSLPEGADLDKVDAEYKNGVLTLAIPKKAEVQPKKITLKGLKEKMKGKA